MADKGSINVLFVGFDRCETFLVRLINGCASAGIKITLAFPQRKLPKSITSDGLHLLWAPNWSGSPVRKIVNLALLAWTRWSGKRFNWLLRQIKGRSLRQKLVLLNRYLPFSKGDWDIIYFAWNATAIDYYGLYELKIPVVVSCRGSHLKVRPVVDKNKDYLEGLQKTLSQAAAVHCISKDLMQEAVKYGAKQMDISIIYPAVDTEFFVPSKDAFRHDKLVITMVGTLLWLKGYQYALMAMKTIIDNGIDLELNIIGDGPEKQNLVFTVQDLGIKSNIIFHGNKTLKEVRDQLQRSDVFLHASLSEGFCNAVLEAQSCGLPIVCFDEGGLPENIEDRVTGFLVPVRDDRAMANALQKIAENPRLREQIGHAGRKRVIEHFSLSDQVDAFITVFKGLIE